MDGGSFSHNSVSDSTPPSYTNGSIIGMLVDLHGKKVWWSKSGTWLSSANGTPVFEY